MSQELMMAAKEGTLQEVTRLISKGTDVNTRNWYGSTALHLAASYGHADVVEYLISKGADLNAINRYDDTPLTSAVNYGHAAVVSILESAAQRSSQDNVSDRRSAILAIISENDSLRSRLGIKPGLEFKADFDLNRLLEIAIKKRDGTDPTLRSDVEGEINFQIEVSRMLCDNSEIGCSMRT